MEEGKTYESLRTLFDKYRHFYVKTSFILVDKKTPRYPEAGIELGCGKGKGEGWFLVYQLNYGFSV